MQVVDPSVSDMASGIEVVCFHGEPSRLPSLCCFGDVVRLQVRGIADRVPFVWVYELMCLFPSSAYSYEGCVCCMYVCVRLHVRGSVPPTAVFLFGLRVCMCACVGCVGASGCFVARAPPPHPPCLRAGQRVKVDRHNNRLQLVASKFVVVSVYEHTGVLVRRALCAVHVAASATT
jgi:hypothetical protein